MRKLLGALILAPILLMLAACGSDEAAQADLSVYEGPVAGAPATTDSGVTERSLFAAKSTYASLLVAAVQYAELPRCADGVPSPCAEQDVVDKIKAADTAAFNSLDLAEGLVRSDEGLVTAATKAGSIQSAITTVNSLRSLLADLGLVKAGEST